MAANNVTGTIQPIAELAQSPVAGACCSIPTRCRPPARCRWTCARAHRLALALGAQAARPQGRRRVVRPRRDRAWPLLPGGGQERGRRRARKTCRHRGDWAARPNWPPPNEPRSCPAGRAFGTTSSRASWRKIDNAYLIGHRWRRLPGHICLGFDGLEGEAIKLLLELDNQGIAISSGSACSRSTPASLPTCWRPWARSAQGPRLAADFAGALQHQGRGRPVLGCCPGPWLRCGRSAG